MSRLIIPSRRIWRQQPQGAVELDAGFNTPGKALVVAPGAMRDKGVTGGSIYYSQTHPSSAARWLKTGALMVADHGGSNDDRIMTVDSYTSGKSGKTTILVVFDWNDSGHDVFRFFSNTAYTLTHDRIGYDGSNGFANTDVISLTRSARNGKTMVAVISIDATAAKQLSTSLRLSGQIVVPSSRTGLASYIGDGTAATTNVPYIGTFEFTNFYHPAGVLRLWAILPGVFLNKAAADALSDNPWQIFRQRPRIAYTLDQSIGSVQLLAPISDLSQGAWVASSGSDLYPMLDEPTADDYDYIVATSATSCEMRLTAGAVPTAGDHILRYRLLAGTGSITVRLKQGSNTIASWGPHTLTGAAQDFAQPLTGGQVSAITNYGDLRVVFESS